MIIQEGLAIGVAAYGQASDRDKLLFVGLTVAVLDGMYGHIAAYRPFHRNGSPWTGFGKGLLSVGIRGALVAGACFAGSRCSEVSDGALTRMLFAAAVGTAIDVTWLAFKQPAAQAETARSAAATRKDFA